MHLVDSSKVWKARIYDFYLIILAFMEMEAFGLNAEKKWSEIMTLPLKVDQKLWVILCIVMEFDEKSKEVMN